MRLKQIPLLFLLFCSFAISVSAQVKEKTILGIKSNLLYDMVSVINIEVEVPFANTWSVAAEYTFPFWLLEKQQYAFQFIAGNLEGRYWASNALRLKKGITLYDTFDGWFVGVYAMGGYYDLEWNKKGYQGEFFSIGPTLGFAHRLDEYFSIEYSLGAGYMHTNYRYYEARQSNVDNSWNLVRQYNGKLSWFGPTKAKVSLIWNINVKEPIKWDWR